MRVKLIQISLLVYLIFISIITKKFQFLPFGLFLLAFLSNIYFKGRMQNFENLIYALIALAPFPLILSIFVIYLPFIVFGSLLTKRSFVKDYAFGFAISLIPTILLYTASTYFGMKLNFAIIFLFFYAPAAMAFFIALKRKKISEVLSFDSKECILVLAIALSTAFAAINIVNDSSLFLSNGTYLYTKFQFITENIDNYGSFPIYDPSTSNGEATYLFEAPLVFSHLAFVNILLPFIPQVAFYNAFSFFILLLAALSMSVLLRALIGRASKEKFNEDFIGIAAVIIAAASIGLNFYFVQLLESFKQFFAFPINYLIFSVILELENPREAVAALYMIALTFIVHTPHGVGIVLIAASLLALISTRLYFSKEISKPINWIIQNKTKVIATGFLLALLPSFYIASPYIFKDSLEEKPAVNWGNFGAASYGYIKAFITSNSPLSMRYPDVNRNDDKKFGPFITIAGLLSLAALIFLFKKAPLNLKLFSGAYAVHIFASAIIINSPTIGTLEYSYRTAEPYLLILLAAFICAFVILIKNKYAKIVLVVVFLAGLMHMLQLARENMENIHREEVISGKYFTKEIGFIRNLPNDGRIITYGLFANAVDPGMSSLTGKYFSRHHLTQFARSRFIYSKIHSSHSFGETKELLSMTGTELANYLRIGGYKYVFLDLRHPVAAFVVQSIYPNFSHAIYQNQYLAFLAVNGTNYAEKVSVVKDFDESFYKKKDGFKHFKLSSYYKFGDKIAYSSKIEEPQRLEFKRDSPTEAEIYGDFKDNEWVIFKESYFPRWKAYIGNGEVPVFASSHNLILVKTIKGSAIQLKYHVLPAERLFGALSFLAAFVFIVIFVMIV